MDFAFPPYFSLRGFIISPSWISSSRQGIPSLPRGLRISDSRTISKLNIPGSTRKTFLDFGIWISLYETRCLVLKLLNVDSSLNSQNVCYCHHPIENERGTSYFLLDKNNSNDLARLLLSALTHWQAIKIELIFYAFHGCREFLILLLVYYFEVKRCFAS